MDPQNHVTTCALTIQDIIDTISCRVRQTIFRPKRKKILAIRVLAVHLPVILGTREYKSMRKNKKQSVGHNNRMKCFGKYTLFNLAY
jgi:hypothetical protein